MNRAVGAFERGEGVGVLRLAGELIAFRAIFGERPHQAALVVGVLEAVQEHVIDSAAVAHAVAGAGAIEQIGRIAHALHAAGDDDISGAGAQEVMGDHRGLHARAAHLVDRGRASRERQSGADSRLARRGLALARRQYAAHQDFVDACRRDPRPLDGGRDRACAERRGGNVLEVAEKAAHRRARRADDDDGVLAHASSLRKRCRAACAASRGARASMLLSYRRNGRQYKLVEHRWRARGSSRGPTPILLDHLSEKSVSRTLPLSPITQTRVCGFVVFVRST